MISTESKNVLAMNANESELKRIERNIRIAEEIANMEIMPTKAKRKAGFEALSYLFSEIRWRDHLRALFFPHGQIEFELPFDLHNIRQKHLDVFKDAGFVSEAKAVAELVEMRSAIKEIPLAVKEPVKKPESIHDFPISKQSIELLVNIGEYFRPEVVANVTANQRLIVESVFNELKSQPTISRELKARGGSRYVKSDWNDAGKFCDVLLSSSEIYQIIHNMAKREADFAVKQWGIKIGKKLSKIVDGKNVDMSINGLLGRNVVHLKFDDGTEFDVDTKVVVASNPVNSGYHTKYPTIFRNVVIKGKSLKSPSEKRLKEALGI